RFLGRISYSLYLLHPIVLLAALHVFYGWLPLWALLAGAFIVTFPVADAGQRLIEHPAAVFGRRAAAHMTGDGASRSELNYHRSNRDRSVRFPTRYTSGRGG